MGSLWRWIEVLPLSGFLILQIGSGWWLQMVLLDDGQHTYKVLGLANQHCSWLSSLHVWLRTVLSHALSPLNLTLLVRASRSVEEKTAQRSFTMLRGNHRSYCKDRTPIYILLHAGSYNMWRFRELHRHISAQQLRGLHHPEVVVYEEQFVSILLDLLWLVPSFPSWCFLYCSFFFP